MQTFLCILLMYFSIGAVLIFWLRVVLLFQCLGPQYSDIYDQTSPLLFLVCTPLHCVSVFRKQSLTVLFHLNSKSVELIVKSG